MFYRSILLMIGNPQFPTLVPPLLHESAAHRIFPQPQHPPIYYQNFRFHITRHLYDAVYNIPFEQISFGEILPFLVEMLPLRSSPYTYLCVCICVPPRPLAIEKSIRAVGRRRGVRGLFLATDAATCSQATRL